MNRTVIILAGFAILCSLQETHGQNVEFVASYDTPARATGIFVSGQYAYVADYADYTGSLQILSVLDPYNPAPVGSLQTEYPAIDVLVSGDYAYLNEGHCGWYCIGDIEIIDVSNPANPDSVGGAGEGVATSFSVEGNYIYGISIPHPINGDNDLYIIDASEPDSAFLVDSYGSYCDEDGWPSFGVVFVSGNFVYVNCGGHFQIWDISDPYNAGMVGSCMGGCATDIFAAGDFAYEACDEIGLSVVNVSNPADPYLVGNFDTRGPARDVFISGHYAYVAERDSGIQIFDISEPENPVLAGGYDTPGYARRVFVQDDLIYVADTSSLMILRFNPQTGIEEMGGLPREFALNQNYPNPFNASTRIEFDLPEPAEVEMAVFDILGRRIITLLKGPKQPGRYSLTWDAGDVPSGIYFARLQAGSRTDSIRMTLLK
jgi:hypothetical protein